MSTINKFKVSTYIRDILLDDPKVKGLIGNKISPVVASKNTSGDFISYRRDGIKTEDTKMGIARRIPLVILNVFSEDYDRSQELASLICEVLEGRYTDPEMVIKLDDSSEDYEDGKYIQILSFTVE